MDNVGRGNPVVPSDSDKHSGVRGGGQASFRASKRTAREERTGIHPLSAPQTNWEQDKDGIISVC